MINARATYPVSFAEEQKDREQAVDSVQAFVDEEDVAGQGLEAVQKGRRGNPGYSTVSQELEMS